MTYSDVCQALEKGTVIFNAAGAHIPKLAGPCLAASDATSLPCSLNMYITAPGKRTSAPPHTDKQDVCVVQTEGCKFWKVFSVPDPSIKPSADVFARGKGEDSLPIHSLTETSELLVETTLYPGDVLFIPAGFPHTTSTATATEGGTENEVTSIHLTFGIDHHIWELDFLSVIRLSYRRVNIFKRALDFGDDNSNMYSGSVNQLPWDIFTDIMAELPLGLLDDDAASVVQDVADTALSIASTIDPAIPVDRKVMRETVERVRQQGMELLDIHRDMYLEALQEGRTRAAEDAMTAHIDPTKKAFTMSPERIQRLSLFRVKRFYDKINESKQRLKDWSMAEAKAKHLVSENVLTPLSVGDKVEAELAGAYFPATVTRITDVGTYDVAFFDGDRETGLSREQIKLLSPPKPVEADTSKMTAKQLKRWKKEQEKLHNANV
jgi:Cupin superfamily protein